MIWLILLFLTYVRADDDSLDFAPPKFPPRQNALIEEQSSIEILSAVRKSFGGSSKTGVFAYQNMSKLVPEHSDDMNKCYENGMGALKLYLFDETIFDIFENEERTIEKGNIYCSPGYSGKFYYEFISRNTSPKYKKSLELYKNKISNTEPDRVHVISNIAAAAAAATAAATAVASGPVAVAAAAAAAYMATYKIGRAHV